MKPTEVAAWVGATTGIGGLLWDFYKWKTAGPKLVITTNTGMQIVPRSGIKNDDSKYLMVWVRNNGTSPTTITTVCFATYESWWARRRLKRSKSGVVLQPLSGQAIPCKLEIGAEYSGAIKQNDGIEEMLCTGKMWCEIYHSWSKRPVQARVVSKD